MACTPAFERSDRPVLPRPEAHPLVSRGRIAAWAALAAAAFLLAACSTADFAYRNAGFLYERAPTLVLWNVEDFLDLTPAQEDFARDRLGKALAWHRRQVLPEYARFLGDLERQLDEGFTAQSLHDDQVRLRDGYRAIVERLLPDAAELFAMLDDGQVNDLARRLDEADRRMLEEEAHSRERRIGRTIAHLEAWTGKLASAQRELVKSRMRALPDLMPQRIAEWRVRQGRLLSLLRERPPRDAMVSALGALVFDTAAWRDPAYAQAIDARDSAMVAMLADVARTLTPQQVESVRARIRGLQADIAAARGA